MPLLASSISQDAGGKTPMREWSEDKHTGQIVQVQIKLLTFEIPNQREMSLHHYSCINKGFFKTETDNCLKVLHGHGIIGSLGVVFMSSHCHRT